MPTFVVEVEDSEGEPISFEIAGHHRVTKERWTETFSALPAMPIGVLADLGNGVMPAADSSRFVRRCLVPEDHDRFDLLLRDPDRIVTDRALANVMTSLFNAMTGRPTRPLVDSSAGADVTGTTSTGGSSSPVLTPVASLSNGS